MKNSVQRKDLLYPELSYQIVGCAFEVYNELGPGHSERTYQKAMAVMLKRKNLDFVEQVYAPVHFKNKLLNKRFLDFIVEEKVVVELKKGEFFSIENIERTKEYLVRTKLKLAILINFTFTGVRTKRIINIQ